MCITLINGKMDAKDTIFLFLISLGLTIQVRLFWAHFFSASTIISKMEVLAILFVHLFPQCISVPQFWLKLCMLLFTVHIIFKMLNVTVTTILYACIASMVFRSFFVVAFCHADSVFRFISIINGPFGICWWEKEKKYWFIMIFMREMNL